MLRHNGNQGISIYTAHSEPVAKLNSQENRCATAEIRNGESTSGDIVAKNYPAFMNATGLTKNILEKIKLAATPERFTQDFLATELGFSSGSARAFIPLAKRLGLIATDGTPTDLYRQFRNTNQAVSKSAMARGIKACYSDIYSRN